MLLTSFRSDAAPTRRAALLGLPAVAACVLAVGVACAEAQTAPDPTQVHESGGHRFRLVPVAEGLQNPWSLAFLPNGDMLVTERSGQLRAIRGGKLQPEPISGLPDIRVGNQGGLLDVVPHPNFAQNQLIYISYSKPSADKATGTTSIIRGRLEGNALTNVQEILEADAWSKGQGHYGSRLAFDANGFLFITVGDRQAPPSGNLETHPAQLLTTHQGKVIRLHDDGRVPADNPFVGRANAKPEIWSYGHRSLQGLAIDPATGNIWESEHGPQGGDELNLIQKGANYGWPVIGYGVNYGEARTPIHASTSRQGMQQPVRYWVPSIATSGLMIYHGDKFPNWKGNIFMGGMNGNQSLARLVMNGTRVASEDKMLGTSLRVRDVRANAAGDIFLVLDDRGGAKTSVVRFEPVN
ncbi:MAG: PQQ-dependent sugar dehydrogenase [Acidobacteria bacterium]|nr:PQQ-dependent sugar dehydrogenase [Acidobacteriota bacterium]